ncbi:hypothetical protein PG985_002978 [Apiospora marii]|uniref:Uncharacterized protein n=1 Tax=Apiospora marii TaxID=335849 RepID=A0ABR1RUA4_9PEZI
MPKHQHKFARHGGSIDPREKNKKKEPEDTPSLDSFTDDNAPEGKAPEGEAPKHKHANDRVATPPLNNPRRPGG